MQKFEYLLAGIFAALGAVIIEIIIDAFREPFGLLENWELTFLAVFVIIEELAKFITIRRRINFTESLKIIIANCFWIGLGFGLFEFGILFLNGGAIYSQNVLIIIAAIFLHITTAILTGLTLAKLKFNGYRTVLAVIPALIVHLAFNYWALATSLSLIYN